MNPRKLIVSALAFFSITLAASAALERQPSPEGAEVYIISPADGEVVGKTFTVQFGLIGMGVAPAGIDMPNTGHHHLLIDAEGSPDMSTPMPMSDNLKHFGGGQTQVELTLAPGEHRLQLVLGDYLHIPHQPAVISEEITITVK
ncbi:DUF4399 domain-containing protein [Pelagicoccus sp. SDUM812002]|uniref:DUF4399 domain-containing protein n=1 Tax=Pelagicoccus sp. SDUM812002 TaxID=3041266 RepID=UPI002810912A|nr:DUF4399 domain-containing protein [Pelagicoccus sp. SDUM812002]MDQ8186307.1 DUF4399 domain-containing protein [Pelagicoccus sp. SDUM812002]